MAKSDEDKDKSILSYFSLGGNPNRKKVADIVKKRKKKEKKKKKKRSSVSEELGM